MGGEQLSFSFLHLGELLLLLEELLLQVGDALDLGQFYRFERADYAWSHEGENMKGCRCYSWKEERSEERDFIFAAFLQTYAPRTIHRFVNIFSKKIGSQGVQRKPVWRHHHYFREY